ncbi:MAG TPA: GIY-YIG nuclease family protein [Anoxybacillus sp.]|nr:GIY-YIG nuclease family protein [Anoxybacillus sp.]
MENDHYFYVVECSDGSYYAGYINNLSARIRRHNEGKGAKYTRSRTPVKLIFSRKYPTKREALQAEYRFKQLSRKEKEQFIIKEQKDVFTAEKL